ncbi:hypothetical protein [Tardiphaga sp.]|jgi:hypothetical protein|uniref:hypothetical protein n=1 Tax=Tardiphaga sp. TaxID=1926292 RepID=UPI0037DA09AE
MALMNKKGTTVVGTDAGAHGEEAKAGPSDHTALGSPEAYSAGESNGQISDADPRPSEEDLQRQELGPRGVPGKADPAKMTPQRDKKTPLSSDPGHTA